MRSIWALPDYLQFQRLLGRISTKATVEKLAAIRAEIARKIAWRQSLDNPHARQRRRAILRDEHQLVVNQQNQGSFETESGVRIKRFNDGQPIYDLSRHERRKLARAYAAGEWRKQAWDRAKGVAA